MREAAWTQSHLLLTLEFVAESRIGGEKKEKSSTKGKGEGAPVMPSMITFDPSSD